ncbi:AAA family ATPase [Nocardioides zeae]|uniref:AAA family ATPase n=1 Tax=Nocardioides zeae TaxID=1457234 RepID=UPI0019D5B64F
MAAFEMLGRVVDRQLNRHLVQNGGFDRFLHRSPSGGAAERIELTAWGEGSLANGYRAQLFPTSGDRGAVEEWTYFHDRSNFPRPHSVHLGVSAESMLADVAETRPRERFVLDLLAGCRVFHFDDTSSDAAPKKTVDIADSLTLHPDARNLAAVLLAMRDEDAACYRRIVRAVRSVAPFFDDFVLVPRNGHVQLRWSEQGVDGAFSADALSDGTLRFICLATLLLQPSAPATIVLDEPELGLHPFAIHQLAGLLRAAASSRKIVAATQSVTLLEQFTVEEVAVVERGDDGTTVSRPDASRLRAWLDDYTLGELWEKNVLGGRPGSTPRSEDG